MSLRGIESAFWGVLRVTCFGETAGLNVAAWKVERVASIGKSLERKPGSYQATGEGQPKQNGGPHKPEFNDDLTF